jgi:hypothetical protein
VKTFRIVADQPPEPPLTPLPPSGSEPFGGPELAPEPAT